MDVGVSTLQYKQLVGRKGGVERVLKTMQNFWVTLRCKNGVALRWYVIFEREANFYHISTLIITTTTTGKSVRGFGEYQDIDSRRGIRTIVRAMKAHWSKAEVQQYASAALLVIGATDPSNHSVKSILKSGGVRALVGALHMHRRSFCTGKRMLGLGSAHNFGRKFRHDRVLEVLRLY